MAFDKMEVNQNQSTTETAKNICRGCLSTDKPVKNVSLYSELFREIANIEVSQSDGLPRWLCMECGILMERLAQFKRKLLRADIILREYLMRCTPFPIDGQDMELQKYSSPQLTLTEVLAFDTSHGRNGFYKVFQHKKLKRETSDGYLDIKVELQVKSEVDVKDEIGFSDCEDDIPLEEIRSHNDKISEEELSDLLKVSSVVEVLEDNGVLNKKIRKREKLKRKKKRDISDDTEINLNTSTIRKSIKIDPTKIMMIKLDPVEQHRQREAESKSPGYLKFPFKCELCYRGFNYETKLQNHMKKHEPARGKYECKLCHMFLPTPYSYHVHEITHTTRYECLACGRRMTDRGSIVEHYRSVHEGIVTHISCHLCGKVSNNSKTHRGHMRNHHSGDRPRCDQCGKTFINHDSLNEHVLIHQGVKNHECQQCGKRFRTKTQAKHHQLKHTSSRDFYCVECDIHFKSNHNLRQHLMKSVRHRDQHALKYACTRCERRFDSEKNLQHHISFGHDGLRLHTCPECGAALATSNSLAKHIRTAHRGYRAPLKHVCDTCGKAFRGKNILVNHVRTHTGEKPFECNECGRKFSQRTAMKTHVKLVHLKIKRGGIKVKENSEPKLELVTKPEVEIVFDAWNRPQIQHTELYL